MLIVGMVMADKNVLYLGHKDLQFPSAASRNKSRTVEINAEAECLGRFRGGRPSPQCKQTIDSAR
ncbi:hypothetical protein BRAO375_4180021 [Bradyrhizobium sp. ORS 375]|nr:hypothetical protein BRAO375_4180021 [Bradyrhizobium sp. ORS 375]